MPFQFRILNFAKIALFIGLFCRTLKVLDKQVSNMLYYTQ